MLNGKTLLITGGTGSFGRKFVEIVLARYQPKRLIILSRDEYKQYKMRQQFHEDTYPCLRYFIGDVRDKNRVMRALRGVDYVIHTAALKHVSTAEYNPFETIQTNIIGTQNIIEAAIDSGVQNVVALSTDKSVNPINLYGATKLCVEKIVVAANSYSGGTTRCSVVRYGNVVGSRGSVVPFFLEAKQSGVLPITDERMTRFWVTLEQAVETTLFALENSRGGEIFVPKLPSMKVIDLAKAIGPDCRLEVIGIRPGEKIHELLISSDEARRVRCIGDKYIVEPEFIFWSYRKWEGKPVPLGFEYSSGTNQMWLNVDKLRDILVNFEIDEGIGD